MNVMLDSPFVIDYLRGQPPAIARLARMFADGDQPTINEVVVCEVRAGLNDVDVPDFDALLEPIEFVQPGPDAAMRAGQAAWPRAESGRCSHRSCGQQRGCHCADTQRP
jgi:predicted nucleic acid-binding protein